VKTDFSKSTNKLNAEVAQRVLWEKDTGLSLKQGKSQVGSYASTLNGVSKGLENKYVGLTKSYGNTVDELAKAANRNKKQTPSALLKVTLSSLEKAQKDGSNAEKLMAKARQQGGKEAARFIVARPTPTTPAPAKAAKAVAVASPAPAPAAKVLAAKPPSSYTPTSTSSAKASAAISAATAKATPPAAPATPAAPAAAPVTAAAPTDAAADKKYSISLFGKQFKSDATVMMSTPD
jgi:hypothetical protein